MHDLVFVRARLAGSPTALVLGEPDAALEVTRDLVFRDPRAIGSPTALVFGAPVRPPPEPVLVSVATTVGSVSVHARLIKPVLVQVTALVGGVQVQALCAYDNRVTHWLDRTTAEPHQTGAAVEQQRTGGWQVGQTSQEDKPSAWRTAQPRNLNLASPADQAVPQRKAIDSSWQQADKKSHQAGASHQRGVFAAVSRLSLWQQALSRQRTSAVPGQTGVPLERKRLALWQVAVSVAHSSGASIGASLFQIGRQYTAVPWQRARSAPAGKSPWPPTKPSPETWNGDLLFQCPPIFGMPLDLVFGAQPCHLGPRAPFYILPARFYMTTHYLVANLLPDLQPVPLTDCTWSADEGSFAWQFSAAGPASLFEQLSSSSSVPLQLQITLDGMDWVFLVESIRENRSFPKRQVSISGRSVTALIGAPWSRDLAYNNHAAATAQQLAEQALDLSGVALDWGITDWLVPGNAWSYAGTRLAAVQAIAEAAGGYLQSHRSDAQLLVRHPYPPRPDGSTGGPWNWGTGDADIELAPDAIITSGIERQDGPDINGVYVSGTTQGVLAWVKREGTAGEKLAAMQTDALITHADAARQRGLAVLGKAGPQLNISLELPILTGVGQPGVIDVGKLVQVNESTPWRGRVRGVSVNANMPKARQTIILGRYL